MARIGRSGFPVCVVSWNYGNIIGIKEVSRWLQELSRKHKEGQAVIVYTYLGFTLLVKLLHFYPLFPGRETHS